MVGEFTPLKLEIREHYSQGCPSIPRILFPGCMVFLYSEHSGLFQMPPTIPLIRSLPGFYFSPELSQNIPSGL